jgi:hypothetical protein
LASLAAAQAAEPVPGALPACQAEGSEILPADRAADDGLARLFDSICSLQVISGGARQSVAGILAFAPEAELALRQALYVERQVSQSREIRPGVVAVDVSIPADRLSVLVRSSLASAGADEHQISLDAPGGTAILATGTAVADGQPRDARPGWRHCRIQDINMSHQAAEQDLRQRVLAALRRIPLSDHQTVGQLARQQPRFDRSLRVQIERLTGGEPTFEPSGICMLACTISPGQVTSMIVRAIQDAELNADEDLKPEVPSEMLTMRAWAVPPPPVPSRAVSLAHRTRPGWAEGVIGKTAAAAGPANEPDIAVRNKLAITAARAEAQRQLWMELEQLAMPDSRSVGDFIAARQDQPSVVQALNGAVFVMSNPNVNEEGIATITLGIRLETVWQIVGR